MQLFTNTRADIGKQHDIKLISAVLFRALFDFGVAGAGVVAHIRGIQR